MSTTSKDDSKADEKPDPAESDETVIEEAVPTQVDSVNGSVSDSSPETTTVDPPWTAAAEPSDSVFADRASGVGFSLSAEATAPAQPAEGKAELPPQPSTDRPVASAATSKAAAAAAVLSARFGRQSGDSSDDASADGKPARKAHLQIARFEPWTVMKFSFVMSLVCFVVLFVAVTVLYMVLAGLGVFDSISQAINETTHSPGSTTDAADWFSAGRVLGYTALLGALNVLLIPALSTVGAVIYNLVTEFIGGIEVTLKEAE